MAKTKIKFICQSCGYESPKWMGKCPGCGEWNKMTEEILKPASPHHPIRLFLLILAKLYKNLPQLQLLKQPKNLEFLQIQKNLIEY
jgi:predicted ATP-dependent serine protease